MVVADARRIDQAADDDASAADDVSGRLIIANQFSHGLPAEPLYGSEQPRTLSTGISRGSESCMVRLTRFRDRRVAQIDSSTIDDQRRRGRPDHQHGTGPPGFHGEPNGCPISFGCVGHLFTRHRAADSPKAAFVP